MLEVLEIQKKHPFTADLTEQILRDPADMTRSAGEQIPKSLSPF
jgi:hypothetical protein